MGEKVVVRKQLRRRQVISFAGRAWWAWKLVPRRITGRAS
jgi:hypothetical protein